ncbi:alpha-1,4-N-acetylglucosaminyltransferase [Daphnia magna]|uniref:Alpha 1,4-glycosyltransferase domain-containing protein n=1 Tax=Daphnia magna TaxID=35525 RepID=A0ABR0AMQ3_9CRUS|nr:alpha-1,4-N-acetylglucosaminyltransferase [Daphnia magna]KAK4026396.1 hypothetical protein OUZ56_015394 [Daphnia magna]
MKCYRNRIEDGPFLHYRNKHVPQWRLHLAVGLLCGILLAIWNGLGSLNATVDWSVHFANEPIARPFKVPGPDSLCPPFASGDTERINFIESTGEECLTPRQACGVESAARANSQMDIKVYLNVAKIGPPGWDDLLRRPGRVRSCSFNQMLGSEFSNVEMIRENFTSILENSPFRPLIESGNFHTSHWSVVQVSDAIRLLLLQKYGGYYLDFDNIVFRSLHCLRNGFSYLEEHPNIENGIMVMDKNHPFLSFLIRYLMQTYNPKARVSLGPPAFGKAFKLFCQVNDPLFKSGLHQCLASSNLTLYHPDSFFPVRHYELGHFYSTTWEGLNVQKMEHAYLTHVYLSSWGRKVHPNSLYSRLARQYCPNVWHLTKESNIPLGF